MKFEEEAKRAAKLEADRRVKAQAKRKFERRMRKQARAAKQIAEKAKLAEAPVAF